MHPIDWTIIAVYIVWIVWDGLRMTRRSHELEGYFLAGRSLPWWAVGLSVMATQLSAITMIGTTGQGYADGMRFLQFYFALPLAMIILSVTLVPFFRGARVYTAYEYLERRFDAKTRAFTSLLFLLSRSMSEAPRLGASDHRLARRVELAGVSPARVSAEAPGSRLPLAGEIPTAKRSVKSPTAVVWPTRGEQPAGPASSKPCSPETDAPEREGLAEPVISR
jgi:hypothetical protein